MSMMTEHGTVAAVVPLMAEAARWAPSVHNTQPWYLRELPDGLVVGADPARTLPVLDPSGRMRTISCGAAVANAETALRAAGWEPVVGLLPDDGDPTVLATVRAGARRTPGHDDVRLASAVPRRRAHRRLYRHDRATGEPMLARIEQMAKAVAEPGARLTVADAPARHALASLLVRAVRAQAGRPELVEEVETWVRHWGAGALDAVDGIPVGSLGTTSYPVDSLVTEQTEADQLSSAALEEELAWSGVVAVSTAGDDVRDWLEGGRALERLWLATEAADLVMTFADQATQDPTTRRQLADLFDPAGHVQVVVRIGRPLMDVPVTPRRPLADLLR